MPQTRAQAASAATGDLLAHARTSTAHTVKKGWDYWLIIGPTSVTTRELRPTEHLLQNGKAIAPYWFAERLRNEVAVTEYLRAHTTIPVPTVRLYTDAEGLLHSERDRIDGVCLQDIVHKSDRAKREKAVKNVDAQLRRDVLPQLQALRSRHIGSVDEKLPVIPPYRVFAKDRRSWPRITSDEEDFVLCHTCLNEQNIYVDPATGAIVGIVGWECAGYFPSYFELPVWLDSLEDSPNVYPEAVPLELAFFGLVEDDLVDDSYTTAQ